MNSPKITINDIARFAGVSKRTVSRVINHSDKVGEKTKELIEKLIAEHGFVPDKQARGLASSRSYLIGLVYDNPDALYIDEVQRGVLSYCTKLGYELVVHPCEYKSEHFIEEVQHFVKRSKLDGLLILPPASEVDELGQALDEAKLPYIRLVSGSEESPHNFVMSDDKQAAFDMTEYLIELNHKKIAMITGPKVYRSSRERYHGFKAALDSKNIKLNKDYIIEGLNTYQAGTELAEVLLKLPEPPSAIFANNDEMAAGALKTAVTLGLKVPEDISICGFDDNLLASRIIPALTTVRRPVKDMAFSAARKLIATIEKGSAEIINENCTVHPKVVVRDSTTDCLKK
ncbi:LacI family DNA-binding transcriptional regulator [Catenovulum maritimum]|uniref:LacI family transcriptional regulator n=1 Tax=Catenovulum maritimum TaxID=1513271 RepID=A0A0J8JH85_9ALTE|nr:LacI family DNA-binding transcriptional regulator [Catenovulum maritimum]KMT63766.1 LacI family transcriptional regulator [Catenovulum maritimum]